MGKEKSSTWNYWNYWDVTPRGTILNRNPGVILTCELCGEEYPQYSTVKNGRPLFEVWHDDEGFDKIEDVLKSDKTPGQIAWVEEIE